MEKPLPRGESSQRQHLPLKRTNSHPPPKRNNFHTFLRREILFLRFIFFPRTVQGFRPVFLHFQLPFHGPTFIPRSLSSKRRRRTPPGKIPGKSRTVTTIYAQNVTNSRTTHTLLLKKKVTHLSLSKEMKDRPAGKNLSSKEIASTLTGVRTQTERGIVPAGATVRGFAKSRTARKDIGRSEGFGKSRGNIWASDERGMRKRFL